MVNMYTAGNSLNCRCLAGSNVSILNRILANALITQIKNHSRWHNVMSHNLATWNNFLPLPTNRKGMVNTLPPPPSRPSTHYSHRGRVSGSSGQRIAEGLELPFCLLPAVLKIAVRHNSNKFFYRMFIGPCIIVIVEELETNLMSLVLFITLNICSTCFEH